MFETTTELIGDDNPSDYSDSVLATMIGTLPPLKGISQYCEGLYNQIITIRHIEFITFSKLYPHFLYPGGDDKDGTENNLGQVKKIHGYDPRSWISTGLNLKGQVVHAQWWSFPLFPAYLTILTLAKIRRKPILITVHNVTPHENKFLGRLTTKIILKFCDRIIVHSEANKQSILAEYGGYCDADVSVIPHGVLTPPDSRLSIEEARDHLKIPQDAQVVLFFGNIRPYKGLDVLLRAVSKARGELPNIRLVIAGKAWQDWDSYVKMISDLNLEDIVHIRNEFIPTEEIHTYFRAADLVVLPYKSFDAQSGVGLTALNFGKPLIVTREGGMADLVSDDISLINSNDDRQLSERLVAVLKNPKILEKMANESMKKAEKYSWTPIAKATLKLYEEVLTKRY